MKFDVDDKNRRRLVYVKFHLNRCRFAVAVAECLGAHFFWDTVYTLSSVYPSMVCSKHASFICRIKVAFLTF